MVSRKELVEAYAQWVTERIDEGRSPYLLTFTFDQLPGPPLAVAAAMRKDIEGVYGMLLSRVVRNPRSLVGRTRCPIWIAAGDFPVPKYEKQLVRDVAPNGGRHEHIIGLFHPISRFKETVDEHISDNINTYLRPFPKLRYIHAVPVTETPEKLTRYVLKSLTRSRITDDEIWVLPRASSELC